jgi:hypothetical protein
MGPDRADCPGCVIDQMEAEERTRNAVYRFRNFALPTIRSVAPSLTTNQIISVQPMTRPAKAISFITVDFVQNLATFEPFAQKETDAQSDE